VRRPALLPALARLAAAGALGVAARGRLAESDEEARKMIAGRSNETLDKMMPVVTDLGSTYAVGGAAAVLWAFGKRTLARDVAAAGGIAWVVAQGAKRLYRRARPYDVDNIQILVRRPAGQSYPSGHPAVAAAMARVLEPNLRAPARRFVARIPRTVAFSRVYVGVHYPTDVIGGLLLGRAVADLWKRYGPTDN
jgi:membrane-associated phospholipid phosphatase